MKLIYLISRIFGLDFLKFSGLLCKPIIAFTFQVQCLCYNESGCNQHNEAKVEALIKATNNDPVLAEVNKSIRQLRADLKRTIQRYSRQMNQEDEQDTGILEE